MAAFQEAAAQKGIALNLDLHENLPPRLKGDPNRLRQILNNLISNAPNGKEEAKQYAIEWAKRAPNPYGEGGEGYIEVRRLFEMEDFAPSDAVEDARKLGNELSRKK